METSINLENQNLNQGISPNRHQNNIYKILFFVFLGLFLVVFSVLVTLLFTQKKPEISKIIETEEQKTAPTKRPVSDVTGNSSLLNIPSNWVDYTSKKLGFSIKIPPNYYVKETESVVITSWDLTTDIYNSLEGGPPDNETYIDIGVGQVTGYNELLETFKDNIISKRDILLNNGTKAQLITVSNTKSDKYFHLGHIEHNNSILSFLSKEYNITSKQSIQDQLISNLTKIIQSTEFKK